MTVLQVLVDGSVTTLLLDGLSPLTEYTVSVYSMIGQKRSEPLRGIDTTCEQTSPSIKFGSPPLVKFTSQFKLKHTNLPQV